MRNHNTDTELPDRLQYETSDYPYTAIATSLLSVLLGLHIGFMVWAENTTLTSAAISVASIVMLTGTMTAHICLKGYLVSIFWIVTNISTGVLCLWNCNVNIGTTAVVVMGTLEALSALMYIFLDIAFFGDMKKKVLKVCTLLSLAFSWVGFAIMLII